MASYPKILRTRLFSMQYVVLIDECEIKLACFKMFSMHLTLCPVLQDQLKKQSSLHPLQ